MDPPAGSDEEFVILSTSDCTESASAPFPQAAGLKSSAELFAKSIGILPSLLEPTLGNFRKRWGDKLPTIVRSSTITIISMEGEEAMGGEGGDKGGDGGTGQGPTIYLGQSQAQEPSEFRTIRLGDIKLIKEFKEMRSNPRWSVSGRQTPRATVRRVYKAKLEGRESGHMTVAMYEGDGAEEAWKQHLEKYEALRHPNIMQIYGLVSTKNLYAMVFHDELIPYAQFRRRFEHSPILTTYIIGYCSTEFKEATSYIRDVIEYSMETSVWIQSSTGQLSLDLAQGGPETGPELFLWNNDVLRLENVSLETPDSEDTIISSLSKDQFHKICCESPIAQINYFQVSTGHPVGPGIFRTDSQYGACVRITEPLQILPDKELNWDNHGNAPDELLPNSWIRYNFPRMFALQLELNLSFPLYEIRKAWLAQANHIFGKLQEPEHVEDYICVNDVRFILQIADKRHIPEGHLFVCPPQDFHTNTEPHANLYQWLACPAYWSLDPSGAAHLSMEDTRILGFPAIHIETGMSGYSWDHSIYQGLRRFHEGKGFDPDSREVARELGYPLYEVLSDRMPFPAREVQGWSWRCEQDDPALCRSLSHYL
ncbi:hypothetical protein MSAN_02377000 [Mycena sanguinolenta]|uniref:Protein kinase domain-containing protein n=1 Tax=Mycena sanguinolenta TaxID=230812 RepID=A0A8H6X4I3_9AGAR|nr:hypothetical protein MSAN_02377000 [Mycena sanguinolenta]